MKQVVCKGAVSEKSIDLRGLPGRNAVCKGAVSENMTAFGVNCGGRFAVLSVRFPLISGVVFRGL